VSAPRGVAVTARVCSGCGAPIVGQAPVVADTVVAETVTDTMVGTVSDAAGQAVAGGVAGQALPEPYLHQRRLHERQRQGSGQVRRRALAANGPSVVTFAAVPSGTGSKGRKPSYRKTNFPRVRVFAERLRFGTARAHLMIAGCGSIWHRETGDDVDDFGVETGRVVNLAATA
jgi:hypothetical protein